MKNVFRTRILLVAAVCAATFLSAGCGILNGLYDSLMGAAGIQESGTVISQRANIRSSYAVVAADVLEVKRGQELQILDDLKFEGVEWYRVQIGRASCRERV